MAPPVNVTFTGAPFYFFCNPGTGAFDPNLTAQSSILPSAAVVTANFEDEYPQSICIRAPEAYRLASRSSICAQPHRWRSCYIT